jgi:hypothetical protein
MTKKKKFDLSRDMVSVEYSENQDTYTLQNSALVKHNTKQSEDKTKLTLSIPKRIAKDIKTWCVQNDTTVSSFLVDAFKEKSKNK